MCTAILPPRFNTIAVNKYTKYQNTTFVWMNLNVSEVSASFTHTRARARTHTKHLHYIRNIIRRPFPFGSQQYKPPAVFLRNFVISSHSVFVCSTLFSQQTPTLVLYKRSRLSRCVLLWGKTWIAAHTADLFYTFTLMGAVLCELQRIQQRKVGRVISRTRASTTVKNFIEICLQQKWVWILNLKPFTF